MKLLIDENLPKRLKKDFPEHEVYHIRDKGWNGKKNGELLKLCFENNFNILLTFDKNLRHQQNLSPFSMTVIVIMTKDNDYDSVIMVRDQITRLLQSPLQYKAYEVFPKE